MVMSAGNRHFAVIGALVTSAAAAFTALFIYTTNRTLAGERTQIWIEFMAADGLRKGDAVLLRGVQVGEVRRLDFSPDDRVVVRAVLTRAVPLSAGAEARLVAADMFGRQTIVLENGLAGRALVAGDTLRGLPAASLTGRIDGVATSIERAVGDSTVDAVRMLLADAAAAASAFERALYAVQSSVESQTQPLHETLVAAAAIAENLRVASDSTGMLALRDNAADALVRFDRLVARLDTASLGLVRALNGIENGNGSLGMIARDDALYERAVGALSELEALLEDVRRNPRRYINVRVF
jgi:phospholipid/cholesterol/gamma-HCH transport system substrate-binding protein